MVMVIKKEVSVDSCEVAVSMRSYEAVTRNGIRLFPLVAPSRLRVTYIEHSSVFTQNAA